MKHVGSYEAKTHLPQLLDSVERGEIIVITRRGTPVALLTRPPRQTAHDVREVIDRMKPLRRGTTLGKRLSIRKLIDEDWRF
jgi:antitoxin (DNA-binding transcriptional repressor) of toxin-antitoxin stability system